MSSTTDSTAAPPLDEVGPYDDPDYTAMNFECPECSAPICEWTQCHSCGWYDEARWERTMERYSECDDCGQTIPGGGSYLCDRCDAAIANADADPAPASAAPTARVQRDSIEIDVYDEQEAVKVATGSYKHGAPGMTLMLHFDYLCELVDEDIRDDLDQLLEIAIDRAVGRIDQLDEESALEYTP